MDGIVTMKIVMGPGDKAKLLKCTFNCAWSFVIHDQDRRLVPWPS